MAPHSRVILCRHSQAEHNVDLDYSIPDAPLTALGKKQSAALAPQIPKLQQEVELIISSALKRTLQSTKLGWGPAVERLGIQNVICLPQAQECNDFPCDTGSPREVLESLDEFKEFNLELLTPDWTSKAGFYAPDPVSLATRAQWVRQYLRDRKENVIVLVAHGDILRRITSSAVGPSTYQWKNAEVREYSFDPETVEKDECYLIQQENIVHAGGYEATSTDIDILERKPFEVVIPTVSAKTSKSGRKSEKGTVIIQTTQQDQASSSSSSLKIMRDPKEVAKDQSIFNGNRIVFPRSDGDPNYGPPNLIVPPATDSEVNYFHVFNRDEQKWVNWSKIIATKLANDYFKIPGDKWALKDFPKDYLMVEQRKGPRRTYRTDPYLYGSASHRFRSTNEFVPHAFWLLCDPTLDTRNCNCIYCTKAPRGSGGIRPTGSSATMGKRASKPVKQYQVGDATSYRLLKPNYRIRAQASPRGLLLPGVPIAVISSAQRDEELSMIEDRAKGKSEGFRSGEMAYCRLKDAIEDEADTENKIEYWPVLIEGFKLDVVVSDNQAISQNGGFNLQGRINQRRVYNVVFMPGHEKAQVEESRLVPALLKVIPKRLRSINLGKREDHPFIIKKNTPELNLENGKERLPFQQLLFCLSLVVEIFQNVRLRYSVTDQFSRIDMGRPAVNNVVFANGADASNAKQTETTNTTSQGNRFLKSTEQNNYMDLDGDDGNSRRRTSGRTSNGNTLTQNSTEIGALDENTYWQGILLGLERIWVGDVARLRLSVEDIGVMINSLAKGNDLYNAEDRTNLNITSPYVIRIKAIYRIAKADVTPTDDKIRVAGDVFRIISLEESQASDDKKKKRNREDGTLAEEEEEEEEEAKRKRQVTDKTEGVAVKKEMDVDLEMTATSRSRRSSTSPSINYSEKKTTPKKKPTFEVPFRPFLEKAYDDQLPTTPILPDGFGYQRVNQSSVEVVCSIQQLAGRLWSSVAKMPEDYQLSIKEKKEPFYAHEDSKDENRIRLSLSGLLAGSVKAMEVHPNEGLVDSRDRAIAEASKAALETRLQKLDRNSQSEEKDQKEEQQAFVNMAEKVNKRENESISGEVGQKETVKKKNKVTSSTKGVGGKGNATISLDSQAAAAAIIAASRSLNLQQANVNTMTSSRKSDTELSIATPSNNGSIRGSVAGSDIEKRRPASPPLPPHWVKKSSRNGLGQYYANLKTKKTSWDRPTV